MAEQPYSGTADQPASQRDSLTAAQPASQPDNYTDRPTRYRRGLTDEELRVVVRMVARTYLEVERGHRDVRALRPFLAPHVYYGLQQSVRRPGAPPVGLNEVSRAIFQRTTARRAYAVVAVREADGTWDALTMVLQRTREGVWHFVEIARASTHRPHDADRTRVGVGRS